MKKFIFSLFALVLFTACDKENDDMFPQQGEEQADRYIHPADPKYPKSKSFKEGQVRDILVIMHKYGEDHNTHFVVRNVVHHYAWFMGGKQVFVIDDYDSRSYDKENLRALGWDFDQEGHKLRMDLIWDGWDVISGDVGDFDDYPHMKQPVAPKGTAVRPCDTPPLTPEQIENLKLIAEKIRDMQRGGNEEEGGNED
ncbi:hypothetical protein Barb6XT_00722 [Bacteroidales bacterium Barb6XT]|nr:hypothetical protein Barb6XT_00722 [Bacteroidales bacterium Barb6XT]